MVNITQPTEGTFELQLQGDFTFNSHTAFRQAVKEVLGKKPKTLNVSLQNVKYIDSSALGMLLLALEECQAQNCTMSIVNASGYVADILNMVMLEKMISTQKK